jgi:hypothetical protein
MANDMFVDSDGVKPHFRGMRLVEWLARERMSRSELARRIERSRSYVSELCDGTKWPSRDTAASIAVVTEGAVTADDFLFGGGDE